MVQPAGAMAMFMLRLAGLISLENAIQEGQTNLTIQDFNLTGYDLDFAGSNTSLNLSHLNHLNFSQIDLRDAQTFLNMSFDDVRSPFNLSRDDPALDVNPSSDQGTSNKLPPFLDPSLFQNQNSNTNLGNVDGSTENGNVGDENTENGNMVNENYENMELLPTPVALTNSRLTTETPQENQEVPGVLEAGEEGEGRRAEDERRTWESETMPQELPHERRLQPPDSTLSPLPPSIPPVNHPGYRTTVSPGYPGYRTPGPHLEALIEGDDTAGLIDGTKLIQSDGDMRQNNGDIMGLEAPELQTIASPLSSRSLVGAFPTPRPAGPNSDYQLGIESTAARPTDQSEESDQNPNTQIPNSDQNENPTEEAGVDQNTSRPGPNLIFDGPTSRRKLAAARPIPPGYYQPQTEDQQPRNNPYPYGPRLLPGPYAPLTPNLPESRGSATEERRQEDIVEYNYEDYEYDDDDTQNFDGVEVQTREPAVLFVFNKPGYAPQPPTTMPTPTRSPTPSDPWDCAPRCPRYTLLDWNTDYDIRRYPATLWVSTVIISDNRVLAELEGYMRVQDYFFGLNDQGLVLNLTVPFVTQVKLGRHPGVLQETNDYTVSLYVQPQYYLNLDLPTPISNEVLVDELEEKTVFVHSFEANVWDVTERFLEGKVSSLMTQLRQNGEAFLDRYYYLASYSRPELYQTVYYELWIYATNFRDPQTIAKTMTLSRPSPPNRITQKTLNKLCRGVECPKFEVLRTYKYGIQKRRYYDGLFASTSPSECHFTTMSVWKGFMPLHLYKHGINSHMEVIEATRPIALVHIRNSQQPEPECPQNLTMSLYLPHRLHSNPPITGYAAPSVHITALNDVIVYAYTVGGYLLEPARVRRELSDMKYRLSEFGACYKDDEHFVVIYDFIVRYHGRQNEIWVVAENCKATPNG